jgi:DNA phosphorothioation-associated putative methyltransferase
MQKVERYKTAILRKKISKPMLTAMEDGWITENESVLDFGCGRGEDLRFLKKLNICIKGYDPHYLPNSYEASSIVNLGYVLNVIEDIEERWNTLQLAFDHAINLLIVSVMIRDSPVYPNEIPYSDGILTSWNTFQKYYTQREFVEYCKRITVNCVSAGVGILYLFKNEDWFHNYLNKNKNKTKISKEKISTIKEEEHNQILNDFLRIYHDLGRIPTQNEFTNSKYILKYFKSYELAIQNLQSRIDYSTISESSSLQKEKYRVSMCRKIIQKNGLPKWKDLSNEEQMDCKIFFTDFSSSLDEAVKELKSLSDLSVISKLINESTLGKVLPDDIYIHKDCLNFAPEKLQIYLELGLMILPKDFIYNIIKIARNSWHITFLNYPDFYNSPHPSLHSSMKVLLHKNQLGYRDYSNSENPPILHRKESFLHFSHNEYEKYSALSISEEEAGLLSRRDIGYKNQWNTLLESEGYKIVDHNLLKC